ncbi:hypothetical protein ACFVYJ_12440 [Pontibacter sp. JAM-7]|uniref:hypothetical protein n=1 Tax=Pontibacter sp. JAM-7 TaxID=3366581 RepID=UPI003AF495AD
MSVITVPLSPTQSFVQHLNFDSSTNNYIPTPIVQSRSKNYLQQADAEYLRLLEEAEAEVRRLIDEVKNLSYSRLPTLAS